MKFHGGENEQARLRSFLERDIQCLLDEIEITKG
jgi:hypothetical protein